MRRLPCSIAVFFALCGCATTPQPPLPQRRTVAPAAPVNVRAKLKVAENLAKSGDVKQATEHYRKIVRDYPNSDVAIEAEFKFGQIAFDMHDYAASYRAFQSILSAGHNTPFLYPAVLKGARAILLDKKPELLPEFTSMVATDGMPTEVRSELSRLRYESFTMRGQNLLALQETLSLIEHETTAIEQERARTLARDYIENKLTESELQEVGSQRGFSRFRSSALFRLAQIKIDRSDFSSARRDLSEVASLNDDPELVEQAQELITDIDARQSVDSKTIGVVLPLSGKNAAAGYKTLRGIQLGLGIYGKVTSNFRLAVIDSEGSPELAKRAVERLVIEDHVIAIIGGLLSRTASIEAARAHDFGVPSIMLSQKSGLTQIGSSVFRGAVTSQMQVEFLVDQTIRRMGLSRFAILYPNDNYGTEFANLFWDEVLARGGSIVGAQSYDSKETDFRPHVQRLVGTYYIDDRMDEFRVRMRQWNEKNPRRGGRQATPAPEDILPPIIDFDALFVPDTAKAVGQIAPFLALSDIDQNKTRLLGTNLWRSGLIENGKRYVENAVYVDSIITTDRSFSSSDFYANFKQAFDEEPGPSEVQAYDSALILRQLISDGESTRTGLVTRLAGLKGFPGAVGTLDVTPDREIKHKLSALIVHDGKIQPIEQE